MSFLSKPEETQKLWARCLPAGSMQRAEHFLYASDIPHWDNEFPGNLHALRNHPTLSDKDKEKILYKNAKELFSL